MIKLYNKRGQAKEKAEAYNQSSQKVGQNIIQKVKKNRYGGGIKD